MTVKPHPDAVLKNYPRIETWEWEEDGILKVQLTGKGVLTDQEVENTYKGNFLEAEDFDIVVRQDCDVYLPEESDLVSMFQEDEPREERLLCSLRRGALSKELVDATWDNLLSAATIGDNRGIAAGPIDERYVRTNAQNGNMIKLGKNRAKYLLPDGSVGTTTIANRARSGIAGWFDPGPRFAFARLNGWARSHPERMRALEPVCERVSDVYREVAPLHWARQNEFVGTFKGPYTLGKSVYTTLTVNKDWQAACHKDAGDFPRGFGSITVVDRRPYEGGWTGFPNYRVAADIRSGDFFGFNIHKSHGVTSMKPLTPPPEGEEWVPHINPVGDHGFDRLSIVYYARSGMAKAGPPEEEAQALERWKNAWVSSKDHASLNAEKYKEKLREAEDELEALLDLIGE